MLKLYPLLYESVLDTYTVINEDKCIQLINQYAKESFKNIVLNDNYIYRGIRTVDEYLYVDSMKSKRVSANAKGNFYTLIMDEVFPKYGYPNRSNAVVGASERAYYGDMTYCVIPYDEVLLGICPERDLWISFSLLGDLDEFNERCIDIVNALSAADIGVDLPDVNDKYAWTIYEVKRLFKYIKQHRDNLKQQLRYNRVVDLSWNDILDIFNPTKNGFDRQYAVKYKSAPGEEREIWFNGKAILISLQNHGEYINKIKEKIKIKLKKR